MPTNPRPWGRRAHAPVAPAPVTGLRPAAYDLFLESETLYGRPVDPPDDDVETWPAWTLIRLEDLDLERFDASGDLKPVLNANPKDGRAAKGGRS